MQKQHLWDRTRNKQRYARFATKNLQNQLSSPTDKALNAAWAVAHATFWPKQHFNERDVAKYKALIAEHFSVNLSIEQNLFQFCIRVALTTLHQEPTRFYWVYLPHNWLDKNYHPGYADTKQWYDDVMEKREENPEYLHSYFCFANEVVKYVQDSTPKTYRKCRMEFINAKSYKFLRIFNTAVLN